MYGTVELDAPVTRLDLERALRGVNLANIALRDTVLQLAARVVAVTDELDRRLEGFEAKVDGAVAPVLKQIRAADQMPCVEFDLGEDKYTTEPAVVPCDELIPLCRARCCTLRFALSTADLDEGVIRWDYGQPYLIRQRANDGYCVHNHPETRSCTVHAARPRVCRSYDCRGDTRIWADFDNRIVATEPVAPEADSAFELLERVRLRGIAVWRESAALSEAYADSEPKRGPT